MEKIDVSPDCGLYRMGAGKNIEEIIATTPETRAISNNPRVMGLEYTHRLQKACTKILARLAANKLTCLEETQTIVFDILRGGAELWSQRSPWQCLWLEPARVFFYFGPESAAG